MDKLLITGGRALNGDVRISGAKNAALPLLVAPLLADGVVNIGNVPHLQDVTTILQVLGCMGVTVTMQDNNQVQIDARTLTSAVAAGVIMASIPAAVAVMSWLFLREHVSLRVWAAVACAVGGISLLSLSAHLTAGPAEGSAARPAPWLGHLLLVAAVLCEAAYAVIGKKLTGVLGPKRITALINLWGFALVTPLGWWVARDFNFAAVAPSAWGLLLFYSLAASIWSVWLWMTGLRQVPAHQAGVFTVLLPISATLVGVLVLGETLGAAQLAAFALAIAGVALATWPDKTARNRQG